VVEPGAVIFFGAAAPPTVTHLRNFRFLSVVAGAIPGTCRSSCTVTVFRLTGRNGGFFFAPNADLRANRIASATNTTRGSGDTSSCHADDGLMQ